MLSIFLFSDSLINKTITINVHKIFKKTLNVSNVICKRKHYAIYD